MVGIEVPMIFWRRRMLNTKEVETQGPQAPCASISSLLDKGG